MSVVPAPALAQAVPTATGGGGDRSAAPGDGFSALLALLVPAAAGQSPDPALADGRDVRLPGAPPAPPGWLPADGRGLSLPAPSSAAIPPVPSPGVPAGAGSKGAEAQDTPARVPPTATLPDVPPEGPSTIPTAPPLALVPRTTPPAPDAPLPPVANRPVDERTAATRAGPDQAGTDQAREEGAGPHLLPALALPATAAEADGSQVAASPTSPAVPPVVPTAACPADGHGAAPADATPDQTQGPVPQAGDAAGESPRAAAHPARSVAVRSSLPRPAEDTDAETKDDPPLPAPPDAASLPAFAAPFVAAASPPPAPPSAGPSRVDPTGGDRVTEPLAAGAPRRLSPGSAPGTERTEDAPRARASLPGLDETIVGDPAPLGAPSPAAASSLPPPSAVHPLPPAEIRPAAEIAATASRPVETPARQVGPALVAIFNRPEGGDRIVVRLEPRDLGQVELRVERPDALSAHVHVSAEKPQTLALLVADRPRLEQALDQAGVPAHGRDIVFHLAPPEPMRDAGLPQQPASWSNSRPGAMATSDGGSGQPGGGGQRPRPDAQAPWDRVAEPGQATTDWLRAGLDITA